MLIEAEVRECSVQGACYEPPAKGSASVGKDPTGRYVVGRVFGPEETARLAVYVPIMPPEQARAMLAQSIPAEQIGF